MAVTTACIVAFCISLSAIVAAIVCGVVLSKSGNKKYSFLTPFNIFIVGFVIAATVMAYPVYFYFSFEAETGFTRYSKSLTISILNCLQMFFLNADFAVVKEAISDTGAVEANFASAYTVYFSVLYVIAPILTFGFVLSFFKDFLAKLKYAFYPAADIYLISEVNERSLALAKDIMLHGGKGRKLVIFANVSGDKDDDNAELVEEAKKLGALCFKDEVTEIRFKRTGKNYKRKVYLIGEDEDKNLKQALELINRYKSSPVYDNYNTQFFVFANSAESEVFLDSIDNGNMKVRRITEYWNTILNMLRSHSIFKTAVQKGDIKVINLLIVGIGSYGEELLKTVCWLGQMPGYEVNIHAFDRYNAQEKFKTLAPEFLEMNGKSIVGEPYYNITFHNDIDVNSSKFCDEIAEIGDVTYAYVSLGNDELNIATAVKLRTVFGRQNLKSGTNIPPIYTIVFNAVKSDIFTQYGGLKSISGKSYGIEFIDGIGTHFTLEVIERAELEEEGLKCHLRWSTTSQQIEENKKKYEKYEYYRRSSIAEALHKATLIELGLYKVDEDGNVIADIAKCEHNRWSAYMRSEGYVCEKKKDDVAKTHYDLKPFDDLTDAEKDKDTIVKS